MAITWGSEVTNSTGNGMRVGYEFSQSPASVGAGTGSVTVTCRVYVWTRAPVFDANNNFSVSGSFGSWSGNVNISHGSGGGTTLARTMTRTVATSYSGTVSSSVSVSLSGIAPISGTARASGSWSTGRRPYSPPKVPSSVSSSRSGTTVKTTWRNNPSTSQPYSNILVRRSINGGGYTDVATLSGTSTSYSQGGFAANSSVRYAIRAQNGVGNSAFVYGATIQIPANLPATPSGATVTRTSDTSHTVRWTNTNPGSSTAPYQKLQVQRWTISGGAYVTVATLTGTPTSYTDRTTVANQQYRYRVRAHNAAGASGWTYTPYISTTPAAPGTPKATKNSAGDIVLTWSNSPVRKNTGIEVWLTEAGTDKPSRYILLAANQTSWTHTNPLASSTWSYRLKAMVGPTASTETGPNLYSAFSGRSNTVQLLTNPLAPTDLAPASVVRDGTLPITMTWKHNEVDGTDQTAFQIAHRVQGETAWNYTGKIDSTESTYILAAGTYANGEIIEWRACTWGLYSGTSPFSTSALITLSTPPSATIMLPEDGTTISGARTGVSWEYYDPEGNNQSQWRATLIDASSDTVETRSGTGIAGSLPAFNAHLGDGETYTIRVEARDSTGLWSEPDTVTITAQYPLPPKPEATATWDHDSGAIVIDITNPFEGDGETTATYNEVWRSINGDTWQQIADQVPLNTAITDYIPALGTFNHYRIIAISDLPSKRESEPALADTSDSRWWVWVNAGPGFMQSVRIRDNANLSVGSGREKELKRFAGRTKPVEYIGEQRNRAISLAGRFALESSQPREVEELADLPAPACVRAPDGQRYFVSTGDPSIDYQGVTAELSWSFTEIDYTEGG